MAGSCSTATWPRWPSSSRLTRPSGSVWPRPPPSLRCFGRSSAATTAAPPARSPRDDATRIAARAAGRADVDDLTIEDPPIEDVIERVFVDGRDVDRQRTPLGGSDCPRPATPSARIATCAHGRRVPHLSRTSILEQFQYRVANYFYMIGMMAEPVIYLVVWSNDRQRARRLGRRLHPRHVRRVLHRVDPGPEHEHRLHPVRHGRGASARRAVGAAAVARPPAPLRPRLFRRQEAGRDRAVAAHRRLPVACLPPGADPTAQQIAVFAVAIWAPTSSAP